jgi:hypothetical protein
LIELTALIRKRPVIASSPNILHHRLGVVEAAVDGDIVDVGRLDGGHLPALDLAHPALGVEHEHVDPLAARDRVDRRAAGVAAGRPDDGQALVAAGEEFLEQQAEQLQRDVLEGERRPVEKLEQPVALVELHQRGDRRVGEAAVGLIAQLAQAIGREAVADERLHHPRRQLGVWEPAHGGDFAFGEARPLGGHIEPAVARQPGQRRAFEVERGGAAAGGDVLHRVRRLAVSRRAGKQSALAGRLHFLFELALQPTEPLRRAGRMRADPALVDRLNRHRVKVVEPLAPFAHRHHQPGILEHAQVEHDRRPVELGEAGGKLLCGQRAQAQLVADFPPHRVGQCLEHGVEIVVG